MSQHLAFAEKMLVGTRGKLNVDPSCISTGELSAKNKKKKKKGIGSRIHNIMSKMCRIQLKNSFHTQNQVKHNLREQRQSADANTKVNKMLELSKKNLKQPLESRFNK